MLLTAGERVLLHLLNFWNAQDPPEAVTQKGIAHAARIRRSHVPRTVKALAREGFVEERDGRVRGRGRKLKVYYLTESGLRRGRELADALEGQTIVADGAPTSLGAFAKSTGRTVLEIAAELDEEGRYRGVAREARSVAFLDRDEELAALADWVRSEAGTMVIYGARGMGKTALARRFLERIPRAAWWCDVSQDASAPDLTRSLGTFLASHGAAGAEVAGGDGDPWPAVAAGLARLDAILVLDGYGDVPESIVVFADRLLGLLPGTPAKLLVLAQETTPSYCRFYHRRAVEAGRVREVRLRGLSVEDARTLLGNPNIAREALNRIYLLTKGCPLYLELIRDGDADGLRSRSRFTTPEVNLLLFSRDVVG